MSKPKVLISDALSPAAVQIFRDRGVEVDFQPNLGKDKDKLAAATRKQMTLRFGMAAALRINRLVDSQGHAEFWE